MRIETVIPLIGQVGRQRREALEQTPQFMLRHGSIKPNENEALRLTTTSSLPDGVGRVSASETSS